MIHECSGKLREQVNWTMQSLRLFVQSRQSSDHREGRQSTANGVGVLWPEVDERQSDESQHPRNSVVIFKSF